MLSKEAQRHLQSYQPRLVPFLNSSCSHLPATSAQEQQQGETFVGSEFSSWDLLPSFLHAIRKGLWRAWIWEGSGSSQTCRFLPSPHSHIPGSGGTQWGDSSKAGASQSSPCLWIWSSQPSQKLPHGNSGTDGIRQQLRLWGNCLGIRRHFKPRLLFQIDSTNFWNINIGYKLNTPFSLSFFFLSSAFSYYSPTCIPWASWILEAHH